MLRVSSPWIVIAGVLLTLTMTGCSVPQDRYDELLTTNRSLEEQVVALQDERDVLRNNLDSVRGQYYGSSENIVRLQGENDSLRGSIQTMRDDYEEILGRVSELEMESIPAEIELALVALAAENAELMEFDADLGRIRFKSDLTFASGSATLTPGAAAPLKTLAGHLANNGTMLEFRVVGHTDSVKPSKPATLRNHPTNTHLSVHRAIAVRDVLVSAGVPAVRIMVAGFGDSRPIVPNGPKGAARNRRVEIFLVPMKAMPAMPESTSGNAAMRRPAVVNQPDEDFPLK